MTLKKVGNFHKRILVSVYNSKNSLFLCLIFINFASICFGQPKKTLSLDEIQRIQVENKNLKFQINSISKENNSGNFYSNIFFGGKNKDDSFIGIPFIHSLPINSNLTLGSIVSMSENGVHMEICQKESDKKVIGVLCDVSKSDSRKKDVCVAIVGKVKIRVYSSEPIKVGDYLVSSKYYGIATKLLEANKSHEGSIIGKALESYNSPNEGLIYVLLILN